MGRLPLNEIRAGLDQAVHGGVQKVGIADLLKVVDIFTEHDVDELLQAFENRQKDLLSLCHELVLRFALEYLDSKEDVSEKLAGPDAQIVDSKQDKAAVKLQSVSRRFLEQKRFERRLLATVFEEPDTPRCSGRPASWLRQSQRGLPGTAGPADVAAAYSQESEPAEGLDRQVRSLRAVRSTTANITARLWQMGLGAASAFRCADDGYPSGTGCLSAGHFLTFLSTQLCVLRQPSEVAMLLRLFKAPWQPKAGDLMLALPSQPGPALPPTDAIGVTLLGVGNQGSPEVGLGVQSSASAGRAMLGKVPDEAYQWQLAYQLAVEFDIAFPAPGDLCAAAARNAPGAQKAALVALRDALAALNGVRLRWGTRKATWKRLLLDTQISLLLEEHTRLEKLIDIAHRAGKPAAGQLQSQLAICCAQLAAARKPQASPRVSVPAFIARLLVEGLSLAPVTVHAAVLMSSEPFLDRRTARVKVNPGADQLTVFSMPLPASPQLLHLTAVRDKRAALCSISLENLSESGMVLCVKPSDDLKSTNWYSRLRLQYLAGTVSGTISVGPSGHVEVKFMPRLLRSPGFVQIESYVETYEVDAQGKKKDKMRFSAKRPTRTGFVLGMPAGQSASQRMSVWYEAVFSEPIVSGASLEKLAPLGAPGGDASEEDAALGRILEHLHDHSQMLDSDLVAGDDAEMEEGDAGEDEETEDEVETLRSKMNQRVQSVLQQKGKVSLPSFSATAEPPFGPVAPVTKPSNPASLVGSVHSSAAGRTAPDSSLVVHTEFPTILPASVTGNAPRGPVASATKEPDVASLTRSGDDSLFAQLMATPKVADIETVVPHRLHDEGEIISTGFGESNATLNPATLAAPASTPSAADDVVAQDLAHTGGSSGPAGASMSWNSNCDFGDHRPEPKTAPLEDTLLGAAGPPPSVPVGVVAQDPAALPSNADKGQSPADVSMSENSNHDFGDFRPEPKFAPAETLTQDLASALPAAATIGSHGSDAIAKDSSTGAPRPAALAVTQDPAAIPSKAGKGPSPADASMSDNSNHDFGDFRPEPKFAPAETLTQDLASALPAAATIGSHGYDAMAKDSSAGASETSQAAPPQAPRADSAAASLAAIDPLAALPAASPPRGLPAAPSASSPAPPQGFSSPSLGSSLASPGGTLVSAPDGSLSLSDGGLTPAAPAGYLAPTSGGPPMTTTSGDSPAAPPGGLPAIPAASFASSGGAPAHPPGDCLAPTGGHPATAPAGPPAPPPAGSQSPTPRGSPAAPAADPPESLPTPPHGDALVPSHGDSPAAAPAGSPAPPTTGHAAPPPEGSLMPPGGPPVDPTGASPSPAPAAGHPVTLPASSPAPPPGGPPAPGPGGSLAPLPGGPPAPPGGNSPVSPPVAPAGNPAAPPPGSSPTPPPQGPAPAPSPAVPPPGGPPARPPGSFPLVPPVVPGNPLAPPGSSLAPPPGGPAPAPSPAVPPGGPLVPSPGSSPVAPPGNPPAPPGNPPTPPPGGPPAPPPGGPAPPVPPAIPAPVPPATSSLPPPSAPAAD